MSLLNPATTNTMRNKLRALLKRMDRVSAKLYLKPKCQCCFCKSQLRRFLPYRDGDVSVTPFFQAVKIVGSDIENFSCPVCGAHDRERHLLLYLEKTGMLERMSGSTILYFAPEKELSKRIEALNPSLFIRADLFPPDDRTTKVDMLQMQFGSGTFDFVIANHVLEHVADDSAALAEIHRVLGPGGWAILQTPYAAGLQRTLEDPGIETDFARLHAYGQEDHVRLYGRDIFNRIEAAGFESHVLTHEKLLADVDPVWAGVNPAEPFFLFRRH